MHQIFSQLKSNAWSLFIGAFTLLFLWGAARTLEWAWFGPKRLERALRKQGLCGTVYRSLAGDLKENARLNKEVRAKPMPLSHDIVPRVAPLFHRAMKEYICIENAADSVNAYSDPTGKNVSVRLMVHSWVYPPAPVPYKDSPTGNLSFTWFGPFPRVTIMDPDLVRGILSNKFGHFQKQKMSRFRRLLADGLVKYEGAKWAKHRRILNPAFLIEKLKRMLPAFSTCCDELIDRWEKSVGPNGSLELDIWPEMQNLTGDVISRAAFGSSYQEGRRIFQLQNEQAERVIKGVPTFFNPFSWYLPTENNRRMKQISREVGTLFMGIIAKREKAIRDGETTKDDLLGLLLESNKREMEQNGKSDSSLGMTTQEVIEECKLFYFAGQETTSVLLTWTMVVLSMHPEWQDKARDEVLQIFGTEKPDFDGLSRLKIMTMILYEVLRLYTPVVALTRQTYKTMQLGDLTIPPGVHLTMPILFIHHDPDIWGPDATEFKPTRFAEGISKATKDGKLAFYPFGWGPRICIGQNFALLEAKMALSMILQRFKFELSEKYQHAPYTVITVHPEHGAPIKFHRI